MTAGELVGFLLFLAMFYQPINQLHGLNQLAQSARAAGERVFDILDAEPEPMAGPSNRPGWRARGEVQFEGVSAGYGENTSVISEVSLHAYPGQVIALVGPTGAGKTTLANLIPRFHEVKSGTVRLDGQDIREIPLEDLRRQVALVSQEPFLFNGTLRENILYGRLDATETELQSAVEAADCLGFISRLPVGLDTQVGERGVRLSVGEKQRVSIARALLKDAPILILDEATASVDNATERTIQAALERLMENRTSFVIAHRLSTIREADRILVLQSGKIVEEGRHEDLIGQDGLYQRLIWAQEATKALEVA